MIEKLGLSDPDGTNFDQDVQEKEFNRVTSYKYLKEQHKDIQSYTERKREFVKEFAKVQCGTKSFMP